MRVASFLYRRSDLEPALVPPAAETYVGRSRSRWRLLLYSATGAAFRAARLSRSLLTFRLDASRYRPGLNVLSSPPVEEGRFVASSLRL